MPKRVLQTKSWGELNSRAVHTGHVRDGHCKGNDGLLRKVHQGQDRLLIRQTSRKPNGASVLLTHCGVPSLVLSGPINGALPWALVVKRRERIKGIIVAGDIRHPFSSHCRG